MRISDWSSDVCSSDLIAKFAPYRTRLDDAIKSGELEPAYAMFALYKQRVDQRAAYARALLKQDIFDFSGNDRWQYDREDAPWAANAAELDKRSDERSVGKEGVETVRSRG